MTIDSINRKLTAILSADAVGYSRLMADDEVGTVQRLKSYRELIGVRVREHRGRVVDSPGDNILAEFPSALDATRCGIEIQGMLKNRNADLTDNRKMEFRIGIHLGDVMVDGDRIYGDGVNIAARLEGLADPGGICISATVHEQVKNKMEIDYIDLGNQDVKNIAEPIHAYRVSFPGAADHRVVKAKGDLSRKWRNIASGAISILIVVGIAFLWNYYFKPTPTSEIIKPETTTVPVEEPSIAVLPFVNMSDDPQQEYFSEGISDDILDALVKTNSMPVIARTSSFQFKGEKIGVQEIGKKLNVTHILEGSVRKVGNRIRITAQLAESSTGHHLWSDRYDRQLNDIFAIQDEIAAAIVKEIQTRVGGVPTSLKLGVRTKTVDEEAYDLYLKAQERFHRYDPSRRDAMGLYQQAVEKDPEFVDAWVGLGRAYLLDRDLWDRETIPREIAPLAKAALQRALDIDPNNATALSLLGFIRAMIEYKWAEGSALMKRGIQLSPQDSEINMIYGIYLGPTHQEGVIKQIEKAYRLDPFSPQVAMNYVLGLRATGRQLDAERVLESFLVTATNINELFATRIYLAAKNLEMAEQHLEKAKAVWGTDDPIVMVNEYQLAELRGDDPLMKSIEKELLRRMESEYVKYNFWGSADNVKRRYQLAYQQRQLGLIQHVLGYKPSQFTDEEWQDLREKMNIAELGDKALPYGNSRTKAEINALLERKIELDPSLMNQYVGVYKPDGSGSNLEISRKDGELSAVWSNDGIPHRMIAVAENQFELLDIKNDTLTFLEHIRNDYDLEEIDGQIVYHYRRIDK